jgi:hypothetical protein
MERSLGNLMASVSNTPLSYFMGYEVTYDPATMFHFIEGPNGETIEFDRWRMEENKDYMQAIVDVVQGWTNTTAPISITNSTIPNSTITKSKPDLRDVSTRDLLNEAFRRGAIKQLEMKHVVSKHMVEEYGEDYMKHLHHKIRQDALASRVDDLEKAGVFNVGKREGGHHPFDEVEFSVDYFICKHPLTLKKEEPYADR